MGLYLRLPVYAVKRAFRLQLRINVQQDRYGGGGFSLDANNSHVYKPWHMLIEFVWPFFIVLVYHLLQVEEVQETVPLKDSLASSSSTLRRPYKRRKLRGVAEHRRSGR